MQQLSSSIRLSDEVQTALEEQRAIVALESTVIAHGLPYPANIEVAEAMEAAIRAEGAVPATIGILAGKIVIGLSQDEVLQLGTAGHVQKVSRRDLAEAAQEKVRALVGGTARAGVAVGDVRRVIAERAFRQ